MPVRTRLRAHTHSLLLLFEAVSVTDDERNDETELKKKVATIFLRATTTTFRPSIKAVSKQNRELSKVVAVRVSSFFRVIFRAPSCPPQIFHGCGSGGSDASGRTLVPCSAKLPDQISPGRTEKSECVEKRRKRKKTFRILGGKKSSGCSERWN